MLGPGRHHTYFMLSFEQVQSTRWVLDECCRRVPDSPEAIELLLNFGMKTCAAALRSSDRGDTRDSGGLTRRELRYYARRLRRYAACLITNLLLVQSEDVPCGGDARFNPEAYVALRDAGVIGVAMEMAEMER